MTRILATTRADFRILRVIRCSTFDRHMEVLLDAFKRGEPPPIHAVAGRRARALAYAAI